MHAVRIENLNMRVRGALGLFTLVKHRRNNDFSPPLPVTSPLQLQSLRERGGTLASFLAAVGRLHISRQPWLAPATQIFPQSCDDLRSAHDCSRSGATLAHV